MQPARLAARLGFAGLCFNGDGRADCVRIAFDAAQAEDDGGREIGNNVLQHSQLRAVAVFQEHFLAAIVIEVGQSEGSSILDKIQIHGAGNVG